MGVEYLASAPMTIAALRRIHQCKRRGLRERRHFIDNLAESIRPTNALAAA